MAIKLKKLMQIGLLVEDVDKMVKFYEENFGITGWEITESNPPDMTINGEHYPEAPLRFAIVKAFGMEFELIQPKADTPHMEWVKKHGSGLHHLAFETEEGYMEVRKFSEEVAGGPWVRGLGMGGLMDYSYLDFAKEAGFYFECYRFIAPGRTGVPFDYPGEPAVSEVPPPEMFQKK